MQFRAHGNWCGPGWTAGQYKDARDLTEEDREVPAVDAIDAACKRHDIGLHDHPEQAYELNEQFRREMRGLGIGAEMMGYLVQNWGPAPAPALSNESTMARGRQRGREDEAPWERQVRPRNDDGTFQLEATNVDEVWEAAEQLMDARSVANRPGQAQDSQGTLPDLRDSQLPALMDGNTDEAMPEAQAQRASGGTGGNQVSKETPISIATPSYGLQETHTTILPWTGWITAAGLDKRTPAQLKLRMNTPWDMVDTSVQTAPTDGTYLTNKGIYASPMNPNGIWSNSQQTAYPRQFGSGSTAVDERPAWRDYWGRLYEYYTVLGCEYEIILYNPQQIKDVRLNIANEQFRTVPGGEPGPTTTYTYPPMQQFIDCGFFNTDCVCAVNMDTYKGQSAAQGNIMPQANYEEMRTYKNIRWYPIKGGQKTVIRGTYKPGQARRDIINDGDVKTWTETKVGLPTTLSEILTLNFFMDPFYNARMPDQHYPPNAGSTAGNNPIATGPNIKGAVNMEINLKYIVQFKDLRLQARYPNTVINNADIVQNLNENIGDIGSALQSWTTATPIYP